MYKRSSFVDTDREYIQAGVCSVYILAAAAQPIE